MNPALEYERPLHVECVRLPSKVYRLFLIGGAALACLPIVIDLVLHVRAGQLFFSLGSIGPLIAAAALLALSSITLVSTVFHDRLQIALFLAGTRVWSRRLVLATLIETVVVRNQPCRRFEVLRRSPGRLIVMFCGTGLRLRSDGGFDCWIGSADPERLAAAIATVHQ